MLDNIIRYIQHINIPNIMLEIPTAKREMPRDISSRSTNKRIEIDGNIEL